MKRLYHFLRQSYQKLTVENQIRTIDSKSPIQTGAISTDLLRNGWQKFSSEEIFQGALSGDLVNQSMPASSCVDPYGNWVSRELPAGLVEKIVNNPQIQKVVCEYLGPDARLDDLYFWFKSGNPKLNCVSERWHDDNVGHRLKFFICFGAGPKAPRTLVVPKTHKAAYRFDVRLEFNRFVRSKRGCDGLFPQEQIQEISYEKDSIIVFDTNMKHRGKYEGFPDERNCLVVEFINRNKSNRISGKAPCGPGQSPKGRLFFTVKDLERLTSSWLIDQALLKKQGEETYSYSLLNLRQS